MRRILLVLLGSLAPLSSGLAGDWPIVTARKDDPAHFGGARGEAFIAHPRPTRFTICHGHTCRLYARVSLTDRQWQQVRDLFHPPPDDAGEERERIRRAVALLERLVGAQTGTDRDRGENFAGLGLPGQMDCIDEATNTTVYLRLLERDGLLRRHRLVHRATRFTGLQPHSTAVIEEQDSGRRYVVDSWFLDNGKPPFVVPLAQWRDGWRP